MKKLENSDELMDEFFGQEEFPKYGFLKPFNDYIQDSIKTIENMDLDDQQRSVFASRLDSICALLSITIYNLKQNENEKS
ncbi:MAG: hypothetical protein RIR47_1291 [Bacteroidota bacterium]|jgi:hypothetical protein